MKYILLTTTLIFMISGCSTKKINSNVNSITQDVTNVFEEGLDKSAK